MSSRGNSKNKISEWEEVRKVGCLRFEMQEMKFSYCIQAELVSDKYEYLHTQYVHYAGYIITSAARTRMCANQRLERPFIEV